MRAIGGRLGVHAMSLYNHIGSKAALLDGLHERLICATRPLATPAELAHIAPFLQVLIRKGLDAREQLFALNVFFTSLNGLLVAEVSPVPGHEDAADPDSAGLHAGERAQGLKAPPEEADTTRGRLGGAAPSS